MSKPTKSAELDDVCVAIDKLHDEVEAVINEFDLDDMDGDFYPDHVCHDMVFALALIKKTRDRLDDEWDWLHGKEWGAHDGH